MTLTAQQKADRVGRGGFVGASEIAAIVGENPWHKPIDVWLQKTGRAEEVPSDPRAKIGTRAEDLIINWYAEDTSTDVFAIRRGETIRHGAVPCVGCTPDYLVFPNSAAAGNGYISASRAVQLKCVGPRMALMWPGEWIPPYVECQVQLEAEVLQVPRVDVAAWLGGTDWRIIEVQRDPEFGSMLLSAAVDFWNCVLTDTPPPVDGSESWRRYLAARYPRVERQELDVPTAEVDSVALEFLSAKDAEEAARARSDAAGNKLRAFIGDGAGYRGGDYIATWLPDKNGKRSLRVKRYSGGIGT